MAGRRKHVPVGVAASRELHIAGSHVYEIVCSTIDPSMPQL